MEAAQAFRQGFLTIFCAMGPFEIPVKPAKPFSEKCIKTHKINLMLFFVTSPWLI
jgi:hypothetical protein